MRLAPVVLGRGLEVPRSGEGPGDLGEWSAIGGDGKGSSNDTSKEVSGAGSNALAPEGSAGLSQGASSNRWDVPSLVFDLGQKQAPRSGLAMPAPTAGVGLGSAPRAPAGRVYFALGLGGGGVLPYPEAIRHTFQDEHDIDFVTLKHGYRNRFKDIGFIIRHGSKPVDDAGDDPRIDGVVRELSASLREQPLGRDENVVLLGLSMGAIVMSQAAILMLEDPAAYGLPANFRIDTLILAGSAVHKDSPIYHRLEALKARGKLGEILYDAYQATNERNEVIDPATGCGGRHRVGALFRMVNLAVTMLVQRGDHPHLRAANNKPLHPTYPSLADELYAQSVLIDRVLDPKTTTPGRDTSIL